MHSRSQDIEVTAPATINTDRPGEGTDSPFLVPLGTIQVENGFFFQFDQTGSDFERQNFSIPTGLVRYGILPNIELRLGYGYVYQNVASDGEQAQEISGFDAISLGAKIFISEQKNLLPQMSLITSFTLPSTGHTNFQSNYLAPTIRLLAGHSVTEWLGITTNFDVNWDDDLTQAIIGYAISFDYSFSNQWGGFTEFYGYLPEKSESEHLFNAGLVYLLNQDFQLDASAGFAFTENAPDFFISAGFAFRVDLF
jgi:hypothetical protein